MRTPAIRSALPKAAALFLAAAVCAGCLTGPAAAQQTTQRFKASFLDVFDTYSEITVYAADEASAQTTLNKAHAELLAYHRLYDIYHTYEGLNNLKTVNDNAGEAPVAVDARLIDLVRFAKEMENRTGGRMNIAMGSVLSIWHAYRTAGVDDPANAALPPMADLAAASAHTDIDKVVVDEAAGTLYLADPDLLLDVGAVAKGYAVEQVAQQMIAEGVTNALLSIGGNVRAIGAHGDGTSWRVSVQNPDLTAADQTIATLDLRDLSLVTSGSYQRYYTVGGKTYHHIIDPDTLMPAEFVWAVSVVTVDSGIADALSTALFTLPIDRGRELLKAFPGTEALWVTLTGELVRSDGFTSLSGEEGAAP